MVPTFTSVRSRFLTTAQGRYGRRPGNFRWQFSARRFGLSRKLPPIQTRFRGVCHGPTRVPPPRCGRGKRKPGPPPAVSRPHIGRRGASASSGGAQSHEPARRFGLSRKLPSVISVSWQRRPVSPRAHAEMKGTCSPPLCCWHCVGRFRQSCHQIRVLAL